MEVRELAPRIVVDPAVRFGRPTIRGTRVTVDLILAKLAGGMTVQEVATDYAITVEDVLAVLAYAARVVAGEDVLVKKIYTQFYLTLDSNLVIIMRNIVSLNSER